MEKPKDGRKENTDSVHFTRHSAAKYSTYAEINKSENPQAPVDVENQVTPDLSERGLELAREKAKELFDSFNPKEDEIFFVSSSEARALETAAIYREVAKQRGFEIVVPENVRGNYAEEVGQGDIRVVQALSLNIKNTLLSSVFNPDVYLKNVNLDALDKDTRKKWEKAREIINSDDYGSWGANFFHYSEEISKIFPEIKSTKDLYETQFKNLLRLVKFGIKKIKESGRGKNVRILAFGHENYIGYALNKYFEDNEIGNCETISIKSVGDENIMIERRGRIENIEQ